MIKTQEHQVLNTLAKQTIPILATQHFDILWRKSLSYYRQTQKNVIDRILDIIDIYPDFCFAFQQAYVLRHYLQSSRENACRFIEAVKNGQIEIVGGLEAIPDSNIPSGESIVRNIMYGRMWTSDNFQTKPKIATMLDAFGSSGQLPQILSKMGYEAFLSGRMPGANLSSDGKTSLFIWKGIDGSEIKGINCDYASIPHSNLGAWYGWGVLEGFDEEYRNSPVEADVFKTDIIEGLKNLALFGRLDNNTVAVISGEEHLPRAELMEAIKEYNSQALFEAKPMRFDNFVENANWEDVVRLHGEYNVEFSGCYTTRIKVKQLNRLAEVKLYTDEFLAASELLCGKKTCSRDDFLNRWRDLAFCQFHDGLCGCHIDENYRHILDAFERILTGTNESIRKTLLCEDVKNADVITVFNVNPFEITDVVRMDKIEGSLTDKNGLAVDCQKDGDKTAVLVQIMPGNKEIYRFNGNKSDKTQVLNDVPQQGISVGRFVVAKSGGQISIFDKYTNQYLIDGSNVAARMVLKNDNGTLWTENYTGLNYAETADDGKIDSIENGSVFMKVVFVGQIPNGAVQWNSFGSVSWKKAFYIYHKIPRVEVDIELFYEGKDTEICVEFDCDIDKSAAKSRYEIPFGSIIRRPYSENEYKLGRGNWVSRGWLDYYDGNKGVAFVHTGTPGCLAKGGIVSFSLLRSGTDYNEPLFPAKPEELSFDNGFHRYRFALIPHDSDDKTRLNKINGFIYSPVGVLGSSQAACCGISIDAPNVVLSAFKPAEDGRGAIVRVYETIGEPATFKLHLANINCRIIETSIDELQDFRQYIQGAINIAPYEIKTFRVITI